MQALPRAPQDYLPVLFLVGSADSVSALPVREAAKARMIRRNFPELTRSGLLPDIGHWNSELSDLKNLNAALLNFCRQRRLRADSGLGQENPGSGFLSVHYQARNYLRVLASGPRPPSGASTT